jgi:mannobiose 2-epimerase
MEAAEVLGDEELISQTRERGLKMARVVLKEGVDEDGAVLGDAGDQEHLQVIKDWWPQAEAVVGFLNAYEASENEEFLTASINAWNWIKDNLVNREHGEWYWGTTQDRHPLKRELAGFWKCPYHNSRMCFEVQERVEKRHGS